ncbi:hypothetical protein ACFQU2_28800 [Siccirubricoccus deserti]
MTLELQAPPQPCRVAVRAYLAGNPPGAFRRLETAAGERLFCTLAVEARADQELVVEFEPGPGVTVPAAGPAGTAGGHRRRQPDGLPRG